jgi:hypothetical protein
MLVLKVERGWFKITALQQRYPGCTITFEHDGNTTTIKVNGLTTMLDVMEELAFVKTCRTQPPHHGGQVQHHRHAQTSPKQGQQGYHGQHNGCHVQPSSIHREGREQHHRGQVQQHGPYRSSALQSHGGREQYHGHSEPMHQKSMHKRNTGSPYSQGAWLCSESNNGT